MTTNPSQRSDKDKDRGKDKSGTLKPGKDLDRLKAMIKNQVDDAEVNLVYAERQYLRAKKELSTAKASYERICSRYAGANGEKRDSQQGGPK